MNNLRRQPTAIAADDENNAGGASAANVDDVITQIRTDLTLIGKAFSVPLSPSSAAHAASAKDGSNFCKPITSAIIEEQKLVNAATYFIQPVSPKSTIQNENMLQPSVFEGSMEDTIAMQAYLPGRPRAHDELPYAMFRKFDPNQSQIPIRRRARPKVLVADGNLIHLIATKIAFDKYFEVVDVCSNGKQVLELLQVNVYDIIFLAAEMEELDGPETAETIRFVEDAAGSEFKCFVVGLLTKQQSQDEDLMDRCFISGMDRFVLRPLLHHVHLVQSTISSVTVSEGFRRAILEKQWFSNRGHLMAILKGTKEDAERSARIAALADEPELLAEAAVTTLIDQADDRQQVESLLARQRHEELQRMNATILQMQDIISDLTHEVTVLEAENKALRETQTTDQLLELQKRVDDLELEVRQAKAESAAAKEKVKQRELEIRQLLDSGCKNEAHVKAAVKHALKHRIALERQENTLMQLLDTNSSHSWYNYYGSIEVRNMQPLTRVPEFATDVTASWFRPQLSKLMAGVRKHCTEVLSQTYITRNDLNRRANAIIQQNANKNKLSNITSMVAQSPTAATAASSNAINTSAMSTMAGGGAAVAGKDELLLSQIVVSSMTLLAKDGDAIITNLINEVESSIANLLVREHFLFEAIEMDDPKTIRSEIGMIRDFINEQRKKRLANSVTSQTEVFQWDSDVITNSAVQERIAAGADVFDYRFVYGQKGKTTFASSALAETSGKSNTKVQHQPLSPVTPPHAHINPAPLKGLIIDTIPATGRLVTTFTTKGHLRKKWAKVRRAVEGKRLLNSQRLPTGVVDEEELELLADMERAAKAEEVKKAYSETSAYYGLNDPNDPLLQETKSFATSAFLAGAGGISKDGKVKSKLLQNGVLIDEEDLSSDTCSESVIESDGEHNDTLGCSDSKAENGEEVSESSSSSSSEGSTEREIGGKKQHRTKKEKVATASESDASSTHSNVSTLDSPNSINAKKEADEWQKAKADRKQRRATLRAAKMRRHQRRLAILPHSHILKVLTATLLPVAQTEKYVHQKDRMRHFLSCYDTIAAAERKSKAQLAEGIIQLFSEAKSALELVDELSLPTEGLVDAYNKKLMLDHISTSQQYRTSSQSVAGVSKKAGRPNKAAARKMQQLIQLQEAVEDGTATVDYVETVEEVEERLNAITSDMPKSIPIGFNVKGKTKSKKIESYYSSTPPASQSDVVGTASGGDEVAVNGSTKLLDENVSFASGTSLLSSSQTDQPSVNPPMGAKENSPSGKVKRKAVTGLLSQAKAKEALLDEVRAMESLTILSKNIVPIMRKCVEKANLLYTMLAANAELIAEQQAALASAASSSQAVGAGGGTTFLTDVNTLTSPITPNKSKAPSPKLSQTKLLATLAAAGGPVRPTAAQLADKQMQNVQKERKLFEDRLHFLLDGDAEIGNLLAEADAHEYPDGAPKDNVESNTGGGVANLLTQLFAAIEDDEGMEPNNKCSPQQRPSKKSSVPLPTTNAELVEKVADAVDHEIAAHADDVHEYAANKALTALLRAAVVAKKRKGASDATTGDKEATKDTTSDHNAVNATLLNSERPTVALSMKELIALHTRLAIQNAPDAAAAAAASAAPQWISLATIAHMFQIAPDEIKIHFKEKETITSLDPKGTVDPLTRKEQGIPSAIPALSVTEAQPPTTGITPPPYDDNLNPLLSTSEDIIFHIPVSFGMLDALMKKTAIQRNFNRHGEGGGGGSSSNSRSASLLPSQNGSFAASNANQSKRLGPGTWAQKSPGAGAGLHPTLSFGGASSRSQASLNTLTTEGSVTDTLMEQLTAALIKINNKQQEKTKSKSPARSMRKASSHSGIESPSRGALNTVQGSETRIFIGKEATNSTGSGRGAPSPLDVLAVGAVSAEISTTPADPNIQSTEFLASASASHSARSSPTAASLSPRHHRLLHAVLATQHDIVSTFAKEDKIRDKQERLEALKAAPSNAVLDLDGVYKGGRLTGATTTESASPTSSKLTTKTQPGSNGTGMLSTPTTTNLAASGSAANANVKRLYFKQQLADGTYELLDIVVPQLTDTEVQQLKASSKKGGNKSATTSNSNVATGTISGKASVASRRVCRDRGTCTGDDNTWAAGGVPLGNAAGYEAFDLVTKAQRQRRRVLIGQRFGTNVSKFVATWQSKRAALLKEFIAACKVRQDAILEGRDQKGSRRHLSMDDNSNNHSDKDGVLPLASDKELQKALQIALAQQQAEAELKALTVPIPKDMAKAFLTAPTVHTYQIGESCEELLSAFGAVATAEYAVVSSSGADIGQSPQNVSVEAGASVTSVLSTQSGGHDGSQFPKPPMEMLSAMLLLPPSMGNTATLPANMNISSLHTASINYGNPLEVQKLPLGAIVKKEGLFGDEGIEFVVSAVDKKNEKEAKKKAKQMAAAAAAVSAAMTGKNVGESDEVKKANAAEEHLNALLAQARADPHSAGLTGVNLVANSQQTIILPHQKPQAAARAFPILQGQDLTLNVPLLPLLRTINACANNPRTAVAAITGQRYPSQHLPYPTSSDVDELLLAASRLWKWLGALGQLALEPPTMPLTPFQSKQIHMATAVATVGVRKHGDDSEGSSTDSEVEIADAKKNTTINDRGKGWYYSQQGIRPGTPNVATTTASGKQKMVSSYEHVTIPPQAMIIHELTPAEVKQFSMSGTVTANTTLSTLTVKKNLPLYLASLYPGASPASIIYYNTQGRNPFHSYQDVMEVVGVGGSTPPPQAQKSVPTKKGSETSLPLPAAPTAALLSPYYTSEAFLEIQRARAAARQNDPNAPIKLADGRVDILNSVFVASHQMVPPPPRTVSPPPPPAPTSEKRAGKKGTSSSNVPQTAVPMVPQPTDPCFTETTGIFIRIPIQDREHFMARVLWQADVVRARHERLLLQCVQEKRGLHPEASQWISKAVRIALGHTRSIITCFLKAQKMFYHDSGYGGLLGGIGYSYYYHPDTAKAQKLKSAKAERSLAKAPKKLLKRFLKRKKEKKILDGPYDLGGAYLCLDDSDLEENGYEGEDLWGLEDSDSTSGSDGSDKDSDTSSTLLFKMSKHKSKKPKEKQKDTTRRRSSQFAEGVNDKAVVRSGSLSLSKRASRSGSIAPTRDEMIAARLSQDANRKAMPTEWEQRSKNSVQIHMRRLQAQQQTAVKAPPKGPVGVYAGASNVNNPLPTFSNSAGQQQQFMPIYAASMSSQQVATQPRKTQATGQLRPIGKLQGMSVAHPSGAPQGIGPQISASTANKTTRLSPPKRTPIVLTNPFTTPETSPAANLPLQQAEPPIIHMLNQRASMNSVAPFMFDADTTLSTTATTVMQQARARAESLMKNSIAMRASLIARSSSSADDHQLDALAVSSNRRRSEAGARSEDSGNFDPSSSPTSNSFRKHRSASHQFLADLRPVGHQGTGGEDLLVEGSNISLGNGGHMARSRGASLARFVGVEEDLFHPLQQSPTSAQNHQGDRSDEATNAGSTQTTIVTSNRATVRLTRETANHQSRNFELVGSKAYSPNSSKASPSHSPYTGRIYLGSSPPTFGGGMASPSGGGSAGLALEGKGSKPKSDLQGQSGASRWEGATSGYRLGRSEAGSQVVMLSGVSYGSTRGGQPAMQSGESPAVSPSRRVGRRPLFGRPNMPSLKDPSAYSLLQAAVKSEKEPIEEENKTSKAKSDIVTSINASNKAHFNRLPPKRHPPVANIILPEEQQVEVESKTNVNEAVTVAGEEPIPPPRSPQQVQFSPPVPTESGAFGNMRPAAVRHAASPPQSPTDRPKGSSSAITFATSFPVAYNDLPVMLREGGRRKVGTVSVVSPAETPLIPPPVADVASELVSSTLPDSEGLRIGRPSAFATAVGDKRKAKTTSAAKPSEGKADGTTSFQSSLSFGPLVVSTSKIPQPPTSPKPPPSPPPIASAGRNTEPTSSSLTVGNDGAPSKQKPTPIRSPALSPTSAPLVPVNDAAERTPPPVSLAIEGSSLTPTATPLSAKGAGSFRPTLGSNVATLSKTSEPQNVLALSARGVKLDPTAKDDVSDSRRDSTSSAPATSKVTAIPTLPPIPSTPTHRGSSRHGEYKKDSVTKLPAIGSWVNADQEFGEAERVIEEPNTDLPSATTSGTRMSETVRTAIPSSTAVPTPPATAGSAPSSITTFPRNQAARLGGQRSLQTSGLVTASSLASSTSNVSQHPLAGTASTTRHRHQAFIQDPNHNSALRGSSFSDAVARTRGLNLEGAELVTSQPNSLSAGSLMHNNTLTSMGGITIEGNSSVPSTATSVGDDTNLRMSATPDGSVRIARTIPSASGTGVGITVVPPQSSIRPQPTNPAVDAPSMSLSGAAFVQSMSHIVNPLIAEHSQHPPSSGGPSPRHSSLASVNSTTIVAAGASTTAVPSIGVSGWVSASNSGTAPPAPTATSSGSSLSVPPNPNLVRRNSNVQSQPLPPSLAFHRDKK